jgi:Na+-dependent transporters of the SNF family
LPVRAVVGAFVLFYLIFLIILGLPIMTMEFAVGRASRKSPVRANQALEKPGQKWHIHGYLTLTALLSAHDVLHHRGRLDAALFLHDRHR